MKTIQQLAQIVEGATIIGDKETIITLLFPFCQKQKYNFIH